MVKVALYIKSHYTYDKNGNMIHLYRLSDLEVEDMVINHNGNQMSHIADWPTLYPDEYPDYYAVFTDYSNDENARYGYNKNGAMTGDPYKGSTYSYNALGMPRKITVPAILGTIDYKYSATGQKLEANYKWHTGLSLDPVENTNRPQYAQPNSTLKRNYIGNIVYENNYVKRILFDNGYFENGNYYFYLRDHLGNNSVVVDANGVVRQRLYYYPYGKVIGNQESYAEGFQPYKFGGKEAEPMFGLGLYDFEARQLDGYGGFTSMDPLAEKYYSISPYAYCANNPLKYVDPDGREVYYAQDGTRLGQLGDNEDIRVLNANLSNKDAMAHIASGSEDAISAMMDGSVAFADYFTNVSDVTNGAALVLYAGNCYDAATTQMENEGYSPLSPTSAIHTKVNTVLDSDIQENTIGGAIKIQTDLNAGKPVMVGVEQSDGKGNVGYEKGNYNQSTSHFVVIRSSNVDKNGTITFNYLDNGTLLGKSRNNNMTLNTSTGMISGRMEQRKATYTVSEVRKSRTIRK